MTEPDNRETSELPRAATYYSDVTIVLSDSGRALRVTAPVPFRLAFSRAKPEHSSWPVVVYEY